jgi:hypothetical protein
MNITSKNDKLGDALPSVLNKPDFRALEDIYHREMFDQCIPFWTKNAIDWKHGSIGRAGWQISASCLHRGLGYLTANRA